MFGLARRAKSIPSTSEPTFVDPALMEELQNKDDRIVALETQNATILTQNATILAEVEETKKKNQELLDMMRRLFPNEF